MRIGLYQLSSGLQYVMMNITKVKGIALIDKRIWYYENEFKEFYDIVVCIF
jgi:hypothetical protein